MNEQLLQALQDEAFVKKAVACTSEQELQTLLQQEGLSCSPKEFAQAIQQLATSSAELSEDDLDSVAGGLSLHTLRPDLQSGIQGVQSTIQSQIAGQSVAQTDLAKTQLLASGLLEISKRFL